MNIGNSSNGQPLVELKTNGNPVSHDGSKKGNLEAGSDDEIDDEYCVYTYRGDTRTGGADLPSSFFTFDQGDSLSSTDDNCAACCVAPSSGRRSGVFNGLEGCCSSTSTNTTHHHIANGSVVTVSASASRANGVTPQLRPPGDLFSPDMDFLEMDFDPGGFGDDEEDEEPTGAGSGKSNCQQRFGTVASPPELDVTDGPTPSTSSITLPVGPGLIGTSDSIVTISEVVPMPPRTLRTNLIPGSSHLNPQLLLGPPESCSITTGTPSRHLMMRLIKSNTLPEIRSQSSQEVLTEVTKEQDSAGRITKNQCLSYSDPLIKNETCFRAVINHLPKCSGDDPIELEVGGVMIWSEQEACQRSLGQIGSSACGATAVCNVLKALGFDQIDPTHVNSCVKTRLRANTAEVPQYLFSRSVAGATHEDLIQGTIQASNGLVNGKFFQPRLGIEPGTFCKWLLHWICKGAVPVVTRNMQVIPPAQSQANGSGSIPDAWHHQMIFGISPDKIYLTNPLERESPEGILPQLTSPSVLLIRRSDVLERKRPTTDLRSITKHPNPEWNELNVLGQVANILLEEIPVFSSNSIAKRIRTTHITIPASYKGGVTLFMPTTSPFFPILLQAPDLL